ncbi:transcription antitermination factor NusB [Streptococcus anginosus]|nr:transcription antitermination factor NusB [Streptococcus anginosus]HBJ54208.1 transcription antitermination factor NusB [Streptococcus sp.]PRT66495.1 transcription antitermination factor NusB [Streptococcus anginosus]PRT69160.1 transcription antitermination factor NusB [Streptococcus anginosus]PRT76535.1 transcription antitermination factor NusB [Streptococcus anginosus]
MRISSMTDVQLEARRELRERAFQALMSLEYEKDIVEACRFAYLYDKDMTNDSDVEIPAFLLNLVTGVEQSKNELDDKLSQYLKEGWTLERLTLVEKNILRLGLFEMTEFDTPQLVAINEAIELSKKFSDEKSSKFINGILSKFVIE